MLLIPAKVVTRCSKKCHRLRLPPRPIPASHKLVHDGAAVPAQVETRHSSEQNGGRWRRGARHSSVVGGGRARLVVTKICIDCSRFPCRLKHRQLQHPAACTSVVAAPVRMVQKRALPAETHRVGKTLVAARHAS